MTFDKFTIKAQEAVQAAVNIAQRNGQQTIEPVHLLSGIIEKAPDVTNYIFQKLGMNGNQIAMLLQQENIKTACLQKVMHNYSQHAVALQYIEVYNQAMAFKHYRI